MAVMNRVYERKLFDSCRVLFGPEVDVGWDFLFYIQISGVKSAFRERALRTHPDRALQRGETNLRRNTERFIDTKDAYDQLLDFIRRRHTMRLGKKRWPAAGREKGSPPRRDCRDRGQKKRSQAYYHGGRLPRRRLLLGEFLFYSGAISWESLIQAIVWQRRQRPRLGDLASKRGWINTRQARQAAIGRGPGVPIGEAMVQFGILNRGQLLLLIWQQRKLQRAFGEFFIDQRHFTPHRFGVLMKSFDGHNEKYPPSPLRGGGRG